MTTSFGIKSNGGVRVVEAGLPFAEAGELAVEQSVAPHPQLPFSWLQVVADGSDFLGEEFRLVAVLAARTLGFADEKNTSSIPA